ncbi:MAG: trypsin-like peptidase domain-containing protein [Planctomycetes bacterium]|nr:trypsin-like peptidase domain-containing protein [Planctomycetota bacterium]
MATSTPDPVLASLFHAGNTCPFCQETVTAGQLIISCPSCGSIHHETCWAHKRGCSSYHCDQAVRMDNPARPADIVLSEQEVLSAPLAPPRPRSPGGAAAAAAFLPPPPERHSRMAWTGVALAILSLAGLVGAIQANMQLLVLGMFMAFAAIGVGVVALLRINNPKNRISGLATAVGATLVPVALVIAYFVVLYGQLSRQQQLVKINNDFYESMPSEDHLARMPAPIGNAMRANVVVAVGGSAEVQSYGSGVILKHVDHTAYILTNRHVIGEAKSGEIEVIFYTSESSKAEIQWKAEGDVDLVILSCPVIALERYAQIKVSREPVGIGEDVFAVGNPMGLSWSYTQGSISGLRRMEGGPHGVELYQTQTPINSGNSGGGLYTKQGDLVGINTLTEDKQVAEGLSFAISTMTLLKLLDAGQQERWLSLTEKETP